MQTSDVPSFASIHGMDLLSSPLKAHRYFQPRMRVDVEEFWVAALNADRRVLASDCLFRGTADHCLFHPRDVFRFVLRKNAAAFLVAHNHPSGNAMPSSEDDKVTEQLSTISWLVEIIFVDHVIVTKAGYYSFAEAGRLQVRRASIDKRNS
jgi:DNA repair protein RadC